MAPHAHALQVRDLHAGYDGTNILRGVSLTVTPGDAPVGILGESGSGKTTLLRAMAGVIKPSGGSVTWGSRATHRVGRDKKLFNSAVRYIAQVDFTEQERSRSVDKIVSTGLSDARKAGRTAKVTVADLLEMVELPANITKRMVYTLSGGERQRLALARAFAARPEILLMDEPLTALDPATRGGVATNISEIAKQLGTAVVLVSHDLELVARMTSTAHLIADGVFVDSGPVFEMLASGTHPAVRDLATAAPLAVQRLPEA